MSQPFDELVFITFVADASTPAEFADHVGKMVGLPAPAVPNVGTTSTLMGIPGVLRSGTTGMEWLTAPALAVPVDQIPGLARQIFQQLAEIRAIVAAIRSKLGG